MTPYEVEFQRLFQAIQQADRLLLVSDGKPDGDSIGSTTAMLNWLEREGKSVAAFSIEKIPSSLLHLDGVTKITSDPEIFRQPYDLVLTFDASDPKRSGITDYLPWTPAGYRLAVFDHHVTNTQYGHVNLVMTDACSTCEVVYRFFETNSVAIDARMATSLLTGIFTDTSNFSNAGTNSKGLEAAAALIAAGARVNDILNRINKNKSVAGLRLWGLALSRLHQQPEFDATATYFLLEDLDGIPGGDEAVEGMSNFLNAACGGCDTILVLRELPGGKVKGSLRSITRDIAQVAQAYGGGGHKKAAGFTVDGRLKVENGIARIVAL